MTWGTRLFSAFLPTNCQNKIARVLWLKLTRKPFGPSLRTRGLMWKFEERMLKTSLTIRLSFTPRWKLIV